MMFGELTASGYLCNKSFYTKEFENLLGKIVACYKLMIQAKVSLPNDENKIRDELVNNYINNNEISRELDLKYIINPEVPEAKTPHRPDIKIQSLNALEPKEAYFLIECKRLNNKNLKGKNGLNAEYINNGIFRFTSNQYSSYHQVNGMIGFVVETMDIHVNIENLNHLLNQSDIITTTQINKSDFINDFEYHYSSTHQDINRKELTLYHLMFNFSENIS